MNYLTPYSCQFLLHFSSEARLTDLTGVIITNKVLASNSSVLREEEYYYSKAEFKCFSSEDDSGTNVILHHKSLVPATSYSFKVGCIYKDIHTTTPMYIHDIVTEGTSTTPSPLRDFGENKEGFCCRCSMHDSEDSMNLLKNDLCVIEINEASRELILMSPTKTLNQTIPIISICNMYFVKQDTLEGLVLLVFIFH